MTTILLIEDEDIIRNAVTRLLEKHGYDVWAVSSVEDAQPMLGKHKHQIHLVISDVRLPGAAGTDTIALAAPIPVLIMTSYASVRSAVEAIKLGAVDYLVKPFKNEDLLALVKKNTQQIISSDNSSASEHADSFVSIVGQSPAMQAMFADIKQAAPSHCNVLITGETGTGKELVAKAFHKLSPRSNQPFIPVNCAAIPDTLIESELFGYDKGAFTGANKDRQGLIEAANHGTLFLDEIGELPLEAQARLLRFLQEGEIRRIGSTKTTLVDVRVIAATHRSLLSMVQEKTFREDLFYRINIMHVHLPPLRDRGNDVLLLADYFLAKQQAKISDAKSLSLSEQAKDQLTQYHWPGNIRELQNSIERACILNAGQVIEPSAFSFTEQNQTIHSDTSSDQQDLPVNESTTNPHESSSTLEAYMRNFILEHQNEMTETALAKALGISRKNLWERRQRMGIPRSS